MGIDAIALLHVPFAELTGAFGRHPDLPDLLQGSDGSGFSASRLDDATLVSTFAGFGDEPDDLSAALRRLLGKALDLHTDTRGIYVFPDMAEPKARTYDALIEELGEVGFWVPMPEAAQQPSLPVNPLEMAAMLQGGMPAGTDLLGLVDAARQQLEALSDTEREQVAAMARQFGLPIGDPADLMSAMGALTGLVADAAPEASDDRSSSEDSEDPHASADEANRKPDDES